MLAAGSDGAEVAYGPALTVGMDRRGLSYREAHCSTVPGPARARVGRRLTRPVCWADGATEPWVGGEAGGGGRLAQYLAGQGHFTAPLVVSLWWQTDPGECRSTTGHAQGGGPGGREPPGLYGVRSLGLGRLEDCYSGRALRTGSPGGGWAWNPLTASRRDHGRCDTHLASVERGTRRRPPVSGPWDGAWCINRCLLHKWIAATRITG